MTVFERARQAADSLFDSYNRPNTYEVCGVDVLISKDGDGLSGDNWLSVIKRMLPIYESVGWLSPVNQIIIESRDDDKIGLWYPTSKKIFIEKDLLLYENNDVITPVEPATVLTHEFIHANHITTFNQHKYSGKFMAKNTEFKKSVRLCIGEYASRSVAEFVAEVGSAIVHTERELPDFALKRYYSFGGPSGLQSLEEETGNYV